MHKSGYKFGKERKLELAKSSKISCGFCKYNKGENSKRKPKPDRHKKKCRDTIRMSEEVENE